MQLKNYFPILDWLPNYSKKELNGDLSAGLTVGVMLIPQGMAYAMLAGLPPIYGLYASTIPLILYAIFGTSRQLAVGPVAMVSLLIATGVGGLAEVGSDKFIALAIVLALIVGIMQLLLGVFRLGFMVNFLSHPVISGFPSAAALIIGLNQLKHLLGIDLARSNHIHTILYEAFLNIGDTHWLTFAVGTGGILVIMLVKRFLKRIPGPLVAVILGILVVYLLGLQQEGVKIVKDVPGGLPPFAFPDFAWSDITGLLPAALTISLVGFMESIAVAKAIQAKHKNYKIDANQELIGLGMANIGGAFFSSFPTTGGFSRTAVNDQSGAKTGLASIFSAVLIILTLLFLTPLFYYLPKAILASVIMVAVFGLIDFKEVRHLWKTDKKDLLMLMVTFFATLITGIEEGIAIGVVLSLALVLYKAAYPHTAQLGRMPGTDIYRNLRRFPEVELDKHIFIYRFDAELFFGNHHFFRSELDDAILNNKDLKLIIINAEAINSLDSSSIHMLSDFLESCEDKIKIVFAGVKGPVRDIMAKSKLVDKIGSENFYDTIQAAVDEYAGHPEEAEDLKHFQTFYKKKEYV
jgi:SulP family sulfate permease